ncbi:hypothetical protein NQZ68_010113 [Dissostichus eleginoides]|nr:hypothetical protein NQZ68_010113 [Dissostichus eleginoides]
MDQRLSHLCPYQWGMTFLLVLWDRLHLYPLSHSDRSGFPKNGRRLPDNCMVDQAIWPFVLRCHPGRNLNSSMVRVKDLQQIATWIEESTLEQQMGPPLLQVPGRVGVRTQIYHHHGGPWALFSLVPDLCDNENIPVSRLFVQPIKTPAIPQRERSRPPEGAPTPGRQDNNSLDPSRKPMNDVQVKPRKRSSSPQSDMGSSKGTWVQL